MSTTGVLEAQERIALPFVDPVVKPAAPRAVPAPMNGNEKENDADKFEAVEAELDRMRRLLDLQEEQIQLLKGEFDRRSAGSAAGSSEALEELAVGVERGASRDEQLQGRIDQLTEDLDASTGAGLELPSTLRESFLPSRYDQSPFVIYNTLQTGYTDFQDSNGSFVSTAWLPHLYLLLRERWQIQVNPLITRDTIRLLSGQIDWFLNDHMTFSMGRFYTPLGFYHERLHTSWVTKMPDTPLVFQQVYPFLQSFNGAQLRGGFYPTSQPVKVEYSMIAVDGFSRRMSRFDAKEYADFRPTSRTDGDVNGDKAFGGRVGLFFPTLGLTLGASALANGAYDSTNQHDLNFLDFDASLHCGNWDLRFEYARVDQQSPFGNIERQGFYAQVAYRNYDSVHPVWGHLEPVFRFDWVDFEGIDLGVTGLDFGNRAAIPIDRNRYTLGLNYYPYPSLIVKFAYQFNVERGAIEREDNGFLMQMTLGF